MEPISDFVAQLRKLPEHCDFGATLQGMLCDRLVCHCKDQRLQCKLLTEPDFKFATALKIAKAMETGEKDTKGL